MMFCGWDFDNADYRGWFCNELDRKEVDVTENDKGNKSKPEWLNHYTTLPVLINMLKRRKLVLVDPTTWEDKNDSLIMAEYKKRKGGGTLLALCFSCGNETIHHWKAFADGTAGCCIEFDKIKLEALLRRDKDSDKIRYRLVEYKKIDDVEKFSIDTDAIPFTKRWPYRCEEEYRIIWEGNKGEKFDGIGFESEIINRITFSQKMPKEIYYTIKEHLVTVSKDLAGKINRSTLYDNQRWIAKFVKKSKV